MSGTPQRIGRLVVGGGGAIASATLRCPTDRFQPNGEPHTIVGCGSYNTVGPDDEGLHDCTDCGIWWNPEREVQ
jgi:hypothetical protein